MTDLHVHTRFSFDSESYIADLCEAAIKKGLTHICFTDHVDYNKADYGYMYYNPEGYFDELNRAKDEYGDRIEVLSGIEFDRPHAYKNEFEKMSALPYDFILASVHIWLNDMFPSKMVHQNFPAEEAFETYWEEIHKAVCFGGFNSLAHMDFPKRYYKKCLWDEPKIGMIFAEMKKSGIALEINTSSLNKGLDDTMPGDDILGLYEKAGCKKVTFGSDSHTSDSLGFGYDVFEQLISGRFDNTVYIKRSPAAV